MRAAKADRHRKATVLNEAAKRRPRKTKDGNDLCFTDVEVRSKHGFHLGPLFHPGSCRIMCPDSAREKVTQYSLLKRKGEADQALS